MTYSERPRARLARVCADGAVVMEYRYRQNMLVLYKISTVQPEANRLHVRLDLSHDTMIHCIADLNSIKSKNEGE